MPANDIEIANLALSRVSAGAIQTLTEHSREAEVCSTHYRICRDSVLRDIDWAFARRSKTLALLASITWPGWTYIYEAPSDCLAARRIFNESDPKGKDPRQKIPYEVCLHPTIDKLLVASDQPEAVLIYTASVGNGAIFDSLFSDMFAWRLAMEIAIPLRGDVTLMQAMQQAYNTALLAAGADSTNEGYQAPTGSGDFVAARA